MFEITPSGQPQQEDKTQPEAVTDFIDTDHNKFPEYTLHVYLLFIILAFYEKSTCKGDCDNDETKCGGGCCTNYYMVDGRCEACPAGYIGSYCGVPCHYPTFGQFCTEECICSQSECHHVYGCKRDDSTVPARSRTPMSSKSSPNKNLTGQTRSRTPMTSKSSPSTVTEHRITVPIKTKYNPSITNHCTEFNSTTIIMIIGGIVILLLILIIIFQIYERNCKNREIKRPAVHVQSRLYEYTTEPAPCFINDFYGRMEANSLQASGTTEDI